MITIAICDDKKDDTDLIESYVMAFFKSKKINFKIHTFASGEAMLEAGIKFDVVFLDIAMGGINGIVAGRSIRNTNKQVKIIYTTDFPEYLTQAVNQIHAFAYLEKPIQMQDIFWQLEDVLNSLTQQNQESPTVSFEVITIRNGCITDTEFMTFHIEDIFYFQYVGKKVMLKTGEKEYIFVRQLKAVIELMKPYPFARCHQNYLVNLQHVRKIKGYEVFLKNGDTLPVSQKKSAKFREQLNKFLQCNL